MNGKMFYGNYRGEVLRNDDPIQNGRVKVRVFGVYDDVPADVIPWAFYADPLMGGTEDVGSLIVPEVGAHVWVFFEGGDHQKPVYWAGAPAMNGKNAPDVPQESRSEESVYPCNKVFKTAAGLTVELDDTEGNVRFRIFHPSGNDHLIDNDGNVFTTIVGNTENAIQGDVTETVDGNKTQTISGDETQTVEGGSTKNVSADLTFNADGSITIAAGGEVNIEAGGNANVTAGGNVAITGALITLN